MDQPHILTFRLGSADIKVVLKLLEIPIFLVAGVYQALALDFHWLESALAACFIWFALRRRVPVCEWAAAAEIRLAQWSRSRTLTCIGVGAAAVLIRLALLSFHPVPEPVVADEFSHLLLSDTLLHGRVSNPPHPFWEHFESLHILASPRYVSNYFPGNAIVLATGRLLAGHPWYGVLLMSGLFSAALCWMLQGWFPARWALAGALIAMARWGIASYWIDGYHGGFLPGIGGCLVAGAYGRLRKRLSVSRALVFATGIGVLMSSRPFEGMLFSLPFIAAIVAFGWKRLPRFATRFALPATALIAPFLFGLGIYFKHITGSPLTTPYSISQQTYGWPMALLWVKPLQIEHRHPEMRRYYEYEFEEHRKVDGLLNFIQYSTFRLQEYWRFFLGPGLTLALILGSGGLLRRRVRMFLFGIAACLSAVSLEGASSPHYFSPATGCVIGVAVAALRDLRARGSAGVFLSRGLPALMIATIALRFALETAELPYTTRVNYQSWCCEQTGDLDKSRLVRALESEPGRHLVIVRAKQDPHDLFQWIYNQADIDTARIVWARDLGPERNRELIHYFTGRRIWTLDPNVRPRRLEQ